MFLGSEKVEALSVYLLGYAQAREDLGTSSFVPGESALLLEFEQWLMTRFRIAAQLGWAECIAEIDPSDRNVRTFFKLFVEFLASHDMRLPEPRRARPGGLQAVRGATKK